MIKQQSSDESAYPLQRSLTVEKRDINAPWLAILIFALLSIGLLALGMGRIVNYVYPVSAFLVGIFLIQKYPLHFVGFTWWIWFLSAFVRRLADYQGGFTNPSPILLAPYLVSILCAITCFRRIHYLYRQGGLVFFLSGSALIYGLCIGLLNSNPQAVLISALDWFSPLCFGSYLFLQWRQYPKYKKLFQKTFTLCVLIAGSYGVFQYLTAPAWDATWLDNLISKLEIVSFGTPEPLKMRVWSTMHGPLIFASTLSAGLLVSISQRGRLFVPTSIVGYLSFLLSQVRTAWISWLLGVAVLLFSLKQSWQIRLIIVVLFIAALIVCLSQFEPFSEVISQRLETVLNAQSDVSANARRQAYQGFLNNRLFNILGTGLTNSSGTDSGLLDILVRLGWIGGIPYLGGILLGASSLKLKGKVQEDIFFHTSTAIVVSTMAQLPLGPVMMELPGMILWAFIGMRLAAMKYHSVEWRQHLNSVSPSS